MGMELAMGEFVMGMYYLDFYIREQKVESELSFFKTQVGKYED